MPSIMELFGFGKGNSGGQTAPVDPAQAATQQQTPVQNQQVAQNTTVPGTTTPQSDGSNKAFPAAGQGAASPLEKYSDLWKAPTTQEGQGNGTPNIVPDFNLDPTKLSEAALKIDFLSAVPQEKLAEAASNPEVFREILNTAMRNVFVNGAIANGNLIQNSMGNAQQVLTSKILPETLKAEAVRTSLAENPAFSHQAAAPVLSMIQEQIQRKHPTASAAEITAMAREYASEFANLVVRGNGGRVERSAGNSGSNRNLVSKRPDTDWTKWLEDDQFLSQ